MDNYSVICKAGRFAIRGDRQSAGSLCNHSFVPNIKPEPRLVKGKHKILFVTLRQISPFEDLVWCYSYRTNNYEKENFDFLDGQLETV